MASLRNLLPSSQFSSKTYSGTHTPVHYITPDPEKTSTVASRLYATTEAALQALDKGYLRSLVLSIYSSATSPQGVELLEAYVINVRYQPKEAAGGGGSAVEVTLGSAGSGPPAAPQGGERFSSATLRGQMVQMICSLRQLTASLEPISQDVSINIRLYYTEATPADYQPGGEEGDAGSAARPLFRDASGEQALFFHKPTAQVLLGAIVTSKHQLSFKAIIKECKEGSAEEMAEF